MLRELSNETAGAPPRPSHGHRLELVVLETDATLAAAVLVRAHHLAAGLDARITILSVCVLPYPLPFVPPAEAARQFRHRLEKLAAETGLPCRGRLVFARDLSQGLASALRPRSTVMIGVRPRWWPTHEERLARRLAAAGHYIAIVRV